MSAPSNGSIFYLQKRRQWCFRCYYTESETGRRKQKSIYADSKTKVREKAEIFLAELNGGEYGKSMSIKTWFNKWLEVVIADTVKIRSREIYEQLLNSHLLPNFGNIKLGDFNAQAFQEHLNELSKTHSPHTVAKVRRYSIMLFDSAIRFGYINYNPVRATRAPKIEKKTLTALSREQTEAIISEAKKGEYQKARADDEGAEYLRNCYSALITLAIDTGLREGEIFGLTWNKIDFDRGILQVDQNLINSASLGKFLSTPKTSGSIRTIVLPERTIKILNDWKVLQENFATKFKDFFNNAKKLVFTNLCGNFIDAQNFRNRCFTRILKRLDLESFRFHDLRHAHASQLIANGVNVNIVKERLGHSSLDVTLKVYAHLLPNQQEAARDDLNKIFS